MEDTRMPAKLAGDDEFDPGDRFIPRSLRETMELALRVANSADGAPRRCRKKACHRTGRCHLVIEKNNDGVCAGGVRQKVLDEAALMLLFLGRLGKAHGIKD